MNDSRNALRSDFITALRTVFREGLSHAFAHLSMRSDAANGILFMPRKSPAPVNSDAFCGQVARLMGCCNARASVASHAAQR